MSRKLHSLLLPLLFGVFLSIPIDAQDRMGNPEVTTEENFRVVTDGVWPRPHSGYPFPIRVRITNYGPERSVDLEFEPWSSSGRGNVFTRRSVNVGSGETIETTLLVEAGDVYGPFKVSSDGHMLAHYSFDSGRSGVRHLVVDSRTNLTLPDLVRAMGGDSSREPLCVQLPADRLAREWQAYAGLPGIWVHAEEWRSVSPEVRGAILRAVRAGQRLVFYETGEKNFGRWTKLFLGEAEDPWLRQVNADEARYGFGSIQNVVGDVLEEANIPGRYGVTCSGVWKEVLPVIELRIEGVGETPTRVFFWIVLAFAFIIGPLNIVTVLLLKARLLLLLTTPLVALLSVVTLFGYSALSEGFALRGAIRSVTWMDPEAKEAVTIGMAAVYSGSSTGTWKYSPETLCQSQDVDGIEDGYSRYRRPRAQGVQTQIDWTSGQDCSGGWVPSRQQRRILTAQAVPCRYRLTLEGTVQTGLRVHNGLGSDIRRGRLLWEGKEYAIPAVPDGGSVDISREAGKEDNVMLGLSDGELRLNSSANLLLYDLKEGEFLLQMAANPLLDQGQKEMNVMDAVHLVRGRLEVKP